MVKGNTKHYFSYICSQKVQLLSLVDAGFSAQHDTGGVRSSSFSKTAPHFGCFMIYSPTARGNDLKNTQSVAAWITGGNLALGQI